ncbi:MAG: class I SAM-dependent methyltransferase [Terracidiphilus sp.]
MALSSKGRQLLDLYAKMAKEGYRTVDLQTIESAFNDMELRAFREPIKQVLTQFRIHTLLDYGCGGSDYEAAGFDEQLSAREYFRLSKVFRYEPARNLDQRRKVDAVLCFDVLEHLFVADVARTVRELFSLANHLLIVNAACYSARALLPNGENAHVTVRTPQWWKGVFDAIAPEYPKVSVWLLCSTAYRQAQNFEIWSGGDWLKSPTFVTTK